MTLQIEVASVTVQAAAAKIDEIIRGAIDARLGAGTWSLQEVLPRLSQDKSPNTQWIRLDGEMLCAIRVYMPPCDCDYDADCVRSVEIQWCMALTE